MRASVAREQGIIRATPAYPSSFLPATRRYDTTCQADVAQLVEHRSRSFAPAVRAAAAGHPELARILGATPYALRRGGISLRVRTEDPQTVARECGTSLQMLNIHAFALEDLRHQPPRPADVEWRAAGVALLGGCANKRAPSAEAGHHLVPSRSKAPTKLC
jgi:hypothetical protein